MGFCRFVCVFVLATVRASTGHALECHPGEWLCDDGNCIPDTWRCDGDGDCLDGTDEMDCPPRHLSLDCPSGQFSCVDSVSCVNESALCDGQHQCPTGSDEENCTTSDSCLDSDWTCRNHICIPKELRCDGRNDCLDNSDEQDCGRCEDGVRCPEGLCLSAEDRCDGTVHCSDGSDEPATCGRRCSEANGGCSHVCTDEPWGARCSCPAGYKLSANGVVCEDVDECTQPFASCLQHCTNTVGSYYCHCREGFTLNGTSTCAATGNATRLLTLRKGSIGLLNVETRQFEVIHTPNSNPVALTFDLIRGLYYWADSRGNIFRTDGRDSKTVFAGEPGIKALACDWLNGHLYWTNQNTEAIYMGASDGKGFTTLLSKNIQPAELVLLPVESLMFWINGGPGDRMTLEKSWMDGSEKSSLVVLTAQSPYGLTMDVAARRLYWISDFKKSIETVKVDGSGRYSFVGLFSSSPALGLAVFESWFYWVDDKGLWQAPQHQPSHRNLLQRAALPLLLVHHELQQPQGSYACVKTPCCLCLLTKGNPLGFSCACPNSKVLLPHGACEYPRFVYSTTSEITMLEFKGKETRKTLLFTTDAGILSFDLDWYRDWLYWVNQIGQVQRISLTDGRMEMVATLLPVCLVKVDQRTGSLYWMSCDQACIGVTAADRGFPRSLYRTKKDIHDMYLDWLRGGLLWLEGDLIFSMSLSGGDPREMLNTGGGIKGSIVLDLRANSLLWNSERTGLTTMSLLQDKRRSAGKRWMISGSIVAAFEPFLLSFSDELMTLWDRRDGSRVQDVNVGSNVFGVMTALKDVKPVTNTLDCNEPSMLCPHSSVCLPPSKLCDGKNDCPDGTDEKLCFTTCPNKGDFKCTDRRSCVPESHICDGRAHCYDGSDEVNCPTAASIKSRPDAVKCRNGYTPCKDGRECVSYTHLCDGERDCQDGSDEQECGAPEQKTTPTKPKVHPSNQTPATKRPATVQPPCSSPSVLCPGASVHLCISPDQFCNGRKDCPDGFDEKQCVKKCPSRTDFRCKDRRSCVSKSLVCDGRSDCHDGSDEVSCPTAPSVPSVSRPDAVKCRNGYTSCKDGRECVLYTHLCDGERDCQDGSDEQGCGASEQKATSNKPEVHPSNQTPATKRPTMVQPPCSSPSVLCPGASVYLCISPNQFCNGREDCPDGFDEKYCVKKCPSRTDFRCKDRRSCVSKSLVCDGHSDCHDGSDEVSCPTAPSVKSRPDALKCRNGYTSCKDGRECVLYTHLCDGESDCQDGSDEQGCGAPEQKTTPTKPKVHPSNQTPATKRPATVQPPCSSPSVLCPGASVHLCISPDQFCNGRKDCPDGFDEKQCVKKCPSRTDFRCKDRRSCVSKSLVCDGRSDCHDSSDEVNCPTAPSITSRPNAMKCRKGSKPCKDGRECVLYTHLCDGETDCQDGSDEQGCQKTCKEAEFQCAHGRKCIPRAQVCDGQSQCQDKSDELDCWKSTKSCQHRCDDNKRCVPKSFLCDGERDCKDGTDEDGCNLITDAAASTEPPALTFRSTCVSPSLLCPGSSLCISKNQMCDGQRDCPDGFDEDGCIFKCKNPADFLCGDRRKCIPGTAVCDSRAHCADASDERNCKSADPDTLTLSGAVSPGSAPLKCRKGFQPCKDGRECVLHSHLCDGEMDCQDGSDEQDCDVQCKAAEFQCSHGKRCIPLEQVCDGWNNCQDRSDEMNCSRRGEGCHHPCDNNSRCIPETFLCDGERDCRDGSDEEQCGLISCESGQFRCSSGQCVSEALRCDGYADCFDRSDEEGCAKPPRCPPDLRCPHSHECLQREWLCDGEDDCKDGSDEKNCVMPTVRCKEYQWKCGNTNQCIPVSWRCDGTKDCHNGMDEDKCDQAKCRPPLYSCGSGECVEPSLLCNTITNCADGSDEGLGCLERNCSSPSAPRCDHHCVSTPQGPKCHCASGFTLHSSGVTCVDVDECDAELHQVCKHSCLNTRGSYICHCHPGFYLEPDNKSCRTEDEPLLLASVQSELLIFGVHSGTLRLLFSGSRPVFSLDYHWAQQRVYWLSSDYQSIRWADVNDSKNKGTLIKGVKSDLIALDWVGNNLYWVDELVGQIVAVRLSNTTVKPHDYTVVLGEDVEQPSSLVLLPQRGLMLWSEIGSTPHIEQCGMDGSKRKVVVSRDLSWPVSLAVDLLDDRLYWVDEKLRCIGSSSLDGNNVKILQLAETPSPFSVAVFNDRVFWSDTKRRTIRSADKITGKDQRVLLKRPGQPFGLKLMHPLSQPAISNPCEQLNCSHFCLLAPASRGRSRPARGPAAVCRCPTGMTLSKDKLSCSPSANSAFILLLSRKAVTQIHLHSIRDGVALNKLPTNRVLALPGITEASALDAAIQGLSLYVADAGHGTVDLLKLSSTRSRQRLTHAENILKLKDDSVTAMAVDWVTSNLYWSSARRPNLHVTSIHDGYTASLLQGSLKGTTSIALHPASGRLCYTAIGAASGRSQPQVDCSYMDGRNQAVLWRKSSIPTSLVFSNEGRIIYWADIGEGVISSIGVDGSGYRRYETGTGALVSFTHIENRLLWVTMDKNVTRVWLSDGVEPRQMWFETKHIIVEVRAYSNNSQAGTNSCSNNNGDCLHLCLAYPGGRTCKCGRDFHPVNVTSCVALPRCPARKKPCLDGSRCIDSARFCDGRLDCPDQSDEQDCPFTNSDLFVTQSKDELPAKSSSSSSSSSSSHPAGQKDSGLSVQKNSSSCDDESCKEKAAQGNHVAVVLSVLCLTATFAACMVFCAKRKTWEKFPSLGSRSTETDTLMANMGMPSEFYDPVFEEAESPVDMNAAVELQSLNLKQA